MPGLAVRDVTRPPCRDEYRTTPRSFTDWSEHTTRTLYTNPTRRRAPISSARNPHHVNRKSGPPETRVTPECSFRAVSDTLHSGDGTEAEAGRKAVIGPKLARREIPRISLGSRCGVSCGSHLHLPRTGGVGRVLRYRAVGTAFVRSVWEKQGKRMRVSSGDPVGVVKQSDISFAFRWAFWWCLVAGCLLGGRFPHLPADVVELD
jgi:hypothetical protein